MITAERPRPHGRGVAVLAGILAPAVFLAVDPAGWYPFGPVKWLLASTLVLAAAALAAHRGTHGSHRTLVSASGVLVLAMALAAAVGLDPVLAWIGTPERNAGVAFWVVCALALWVGQQAVEIGADGTPRSVPRPIRLGLLVAAAGVALVGVAEALGWTPALLDAGDRLTGTMGSSAYLGAVAALLLPVSVGLALATWRSSGSSRRTSVTSVAAVGAAAGLLVVLAGSGARAAWVGLAVGGVVLVVAQRGWIGAHRRSAGIVAALAGIAVVVVLAVTPMGARLGSLSDHDAPGGRGRLDEWRVAGRVLADHPVSGVGPEGYRIAFAAGVDRAYEDRHGRDPLPDRAHSGPLDIALAGGPVALGAWACIAAVVGRSAWRAMRAGRPVECGLAVALVAHGVGQVFLFPLAEVEPVAWLLAGVLVATQARPGEVRRWSPSRPWAPRLVAAGLAVAAIAAMGAGALAVTADRRADRAATTGSVAAAEGAVRLRPDHPRLHLLLAQVRVADDAGIHRAVEAVRHGREWSPDDPVLRRSEARYLVDRALATEVPAHAAEARSFVWRALADDPLDSELWARALVLAALDG